MQKGSTEVADTMERIVFTTEEDTEVEFYVLEQTRIGGVNYLLVADSEGDEAEALILKEQASEDTGEEAVYDIVEDEKELNAISKVFIEMMDDVDIELEMENEEN